MLVREQRSDEDHIVRATGGRLASKVIPRLARLAVTRLLGVAPQYPYSLNMLSAYNLRLEPDIVHLHWVNDSFVDIKELAALPYPVVWTLHDNWAFTGGCHCPFTCTRYESDCADCPLITRHALRGAARYQLAYKRSHLPARLHIVTPSQWLADRVRRSSLLRDTPVSTIVNPLDLMVYRPIEQTLARELLGLPADKRLLLFGEDSADHPPHKGYDLLIAALHQLATEPSVAADTELVVFGAGRPHGETLPLPAHYLGRVSDDIALTLLYSACDLFICPSREDNLPNTIVEAAACGTAAVGFDACGIPDLIIPGKTGELATPYDTSSLATAIKHALDHSEQLGSGARHHALETFSESTVASAYLALYTELLANA